MSTCKRKAMPRINFLYLAQLIYKHVAICDIQTICEPKCLHYNVIIKLKINDITLQLYT